MSAQKAQRIDHNHSQGRSQDLVWKWAVGTHLGPSRQETCNVPAVQWRILVLAGGAMAPYGCGGPGAAGAGGGGGPGVGGAEGEEKGGKEKGGTKGDKRGTFPQSFDLFTSSKHIFQECH